MNQNAEVLLTELKAVLGDLYDQNDDKNKELIGLIRALVRRIEATEHEIFNTNGSINELRLRIKSLEYFAKNLKEEEAEEKNNKQAKKTMWFGFIGKTIAALCIGLAGWIISHIEWI